MGSGKEFAKIEKGLNLFTDPCASDVNVQADEITYAPPPRYARAVTGEDMSFANNTHTIIARSQGQGQGRGRHAVWIFIVLSK